jgi:peptidoglycan/LPS O-acetylase OafA/YrhL
MNALQDLLRTPAALWRHAGRPTGVKGFVSFDALRGYMAWWVVVGHALHITGMQDRFLSAFTAGDHAVNVFVSLSGFVICHLLLERQESYQAYLTRRAFRIFPIYLLALACAIALSGAYDFVYQGDWIFEREMRQLRAASTDANFATYLGLHLTLLHGLVPDTWLPFSASSLLAPAWSLSLEWQFYLIAPLIVGALARPRWSRLASFISSALPGSCSRSSCLCIGNTHPYFRCRFTSSCWVSCRASSCRWFRDSRRGSFPWA